MDKRHGWVIILSIIGMIFFLGVIAVYYVIHKPFDSKILLSILQAFRDILLASALIVLAGGIGRKILGEPHPDPLANRVLQAAFGLGLLVLIFQKQESIQYQR